MTESDNDREFLESAGIEPDSFETEEHRAQLGSFAQRALARSIDLLVIAVIMLPFLAPTVGDGDASDGVSRTLALGSLVAWLVYEAGLHHVARPHHRQDGDAHHGRRLPHRQDPESGEGGHPGRDRPRRRRGHRRLRHHRLRHGGVRPRHAAGLLDRAAGTAVVLA